MTSFHPDFFSYDPQRSGDPTVEMLEQSLLQVKQPLVLRRSADAPVFLEAGNARYRSYLSFGRATDLDAAVQAYKEALTLDAGNPEIHVKLASALWDQGGVTLSVAMEACETALSLDPLYSDACLLKGYLLKSAGCVEEALSQFRMAVQKAEMRQQSPAKARLALGKTLFHKAGLPNRRKKQTLWNRLTAATSGFGQFTTGLLQLPGDRETFGVLKRAMITDSQILGITSCGRVLKLLGLRQQVKALYSRAHAMLPEESLFPHLLGDMQSETNALDAAIGYYREALALEPDNALILKKLGFSYGEADDKFSAIDVLQRVVAMGDADFDTIYTLAHFYVDTQDYVHALYYYRELLSTAPQNPYLHSNMAYVLFKLEDFDGAIDSYHDAVRYGDDPIWTSTVAQTLGTIYNQIKEDLPEAEKMFQLAYELDHSNIDCLIVLGDLYTEQGNFEAALETYQFLLNVEPDNADCHNYMGYLQWQLDRNDEAVDSYRQAIALNPDNPVAYNNLGVIYLDEKCQPPSALTMFEKAMTLKPDYTLACFNVARSREAMGQTADAAHGYTQALELNEANPELESDEIQERLARLFDAH